MKLKNKKIELAFTSFDLLPKTLGGFRKVTHQFEDFINRFEKSKQFALYLASDCKEGINLSIALRDFITSKNEGMHSTWEYPTFTELHNATIQHFSNNKKYDDIKDIRH